MSTDKKNCRSNITQSKPTAHLLHGYIGSGKTTFARQLAIELPAVRFSHDEWFVKLYGQNPPEERFDELFNNVGDLLWQQAMATLAVGMDVILDIGFWTLEDREYARERVSSAGGIPKFYKISCPMDLMRERTLKRSENPPLDSFWIDGPAFDKLLARYQPMGESEDFVEIDGCG